ncbi:MAG: aminopeptidase P family N-terminal domain-containing protein [Nanoarchaeota archaeon]|nr:aminopeptidase P family N-terminal domain-containing protein [Nanoarchaeota archaeon]
MIKIVCVLEYSGGIIAQLFSSATIIKIKNFQDTENLRFSRVFENTNYFYQFFVFSTISLSKDLKYKQISQNTMRINEFKGILKDKKSDFALFYNLDSTKINPNMFYFSGYNGLGALVISKKASFLMVPEMELQRAKQSMALTARHKLWTSGLRRW